MIPYAAPPAPTRVQKLWPGETFVVLGGGPSLTAADVAYCRGKAQVIAVKEAHRFGDWIPVVYACEAAWWNFYKGLNTYTGLKYALEPTKWRDVQSLENTGHEGLELEPTGLRTGSNSGYQAINLAVHLGAAKIVLLGFDLWRGADGRANWWTGQGGVWPHHRDSPYPVFLQRFTTIVEPLKAAGVEVVNCSRHTVLQAFPRVPLEEVL